VRDSLQLGYFGHHKCASSWISNILIHVCLELGVKYNHFHSSDDFNNDMQNYLSQNQIDIFGYGNANYDKVKDMKNIIGFHIYRDPRDLLISAYFSHLNSHPTDIWPELINHRKQLEELSVEEGLLAELDFNNQIFDEISKWDYSDSRFLNVKMESLTKEPYSGFLDIFSFIGLLDESDFRLSSRLNYWIRSRVNRLTSFTSFAKMKKIPAPQLLSIVYMRRFSKMAGGRKKGVEEKNSHYRSGVAGDWKKYFSEDIKTVFKQRHGQLMINLGYEKDDNW